MTSERLKMFLKLEDSDAFHKVQSFYIENEKFARLWEEKNLAGIESLLCQRVLELPNNRIFVHPCPTDEEIYKDYSFAGVYKSYKPYRNLDSCSNIKYAVKQICFDRFSYFADYYYRNLNGMGNRDIDLFVSCENDNVCGFGTGYADSQKCVFQYYDSPLSMYRREAKRLKARKEDADILLNELQRNIIYALFSAQEQINDIVDIEFVFNRRCSVIINEIRALSAAHRKNWVMVQNNCWKINKAPSTCINTVGRLKRKVKVWNEGFDIDCFDMQRDVLCVNYKSDEQMFGILMKLEGARNISIIISYPIFIVDSHFSYTLFEYDMFEFILRCVDETFVQDQTIIIDSRGFGYSIKAVL